MSRSPREGETAKGPRIGFLGRIIIALAAAGLIPVLVVSFRLVDLNRDALTSQVLQTHALSANTAATSIESTLAAWRTILSGIAADADLSAGISADSAKTTVRNILDGDPDVAAIIVEAADGREIFRGQKRSVASRLAAFVQPGERAPIQVSSDSPRLIAVTVPIAGGGRITGVFTGDAIANVLQSSELGAEAARVLVDRKGNRLFSAGVPAVVPNQLLQLAVDGRIRGSGRFPTSSGREIVGAYAPVIDTPWVVISAQPATVAEAVAATLRTRAGIAIAAALLLVALLSVAAWYVVVRPVRALLDVQAEIGVESSGESDLDRLRSSIDLLRKRVRDREDLGQVFLGRFQVLNTLGHGGMGTVFRGWDPRLQRAVALKTIRLSEDVDATEKSSLIAALMREAVIIAQFHHPNIVSVFDVEESADAAFIAMEFVDGVSLETQLDGRPLTPGHITLVGTAIASALLAAHDANVIHRDVKPANVLISWEGNIKVTDFGIADLLNAIRSDRTSVFGTPGYMAPELIEGKPATPASDAFSAGVLLYRCATGREPFERGAIRDTILATLHDDPPAPFEINPSVPPLLNRVIVRLLAKSPEDRMGSSRELLETLRAIPAERKFTLRNVSPTKTRRSGEDQRYVPTLPVANG